MILITFNPRNLNIQKKNSKYNFLQHYMHLLYQIIFIKMERQNDSSSQSQYFQCQVYEDSFKSNKKVNGNSFKSQYQYIKESINIFSEQQKNQQASNKHTNTRLTCSNYLQQYYNYFQEVQTEADKHIKQCISNITQTLKHKIVIINNKSSFRQFVSFAAPIIIISGNLYGGVIIKYQIIVGNHKLKVDLLNMQKKASNTLVKIGFGGYGSIYRIRYSKNKTIVAKRIVFKSKTKIKFQEKQIQPNRIQIHESLYQYSIYKICSFYKIGPQISNELGFDLVCFANCLQFYMEECLRGRYNCDRIEKDLKLCLRVLHKIKIIHKDVKPANILFSYSQNRFVLCDYGISHPIEEQIGFKSKTYNQGSLGFMSQQMQRIKKDNQSYVDLYYNDLYGLKCSILQFKNHYQAHQQFLKIQKFQNYDEENILSVIEKQTYQSIYLFKLYLFLKSEGKQLSKQKQTLYLKKMNVMIKQIFQIYSKEQVTTISQLVYKIQMRQNGYYLQYLIRCYGLTKELRYELNKLIPTSQIQKLKQRIKDEKYNNFISEQKLQKFRYISHKNRYLFSLQCQLEQYKYLQKQLYTSFKVKILNILLQIFYCKIQIARDSSFIMLIQQIKQICINSGIEGQNIFVFKCITQILLTSDQQKVKNYLRESKKLYPSSQQKVYTYLLKYHIANLDNNDQIMKYGKKLQKIYKQHGVYIDSYVWLICQLAMAYQKSNKKISMHYFQELRQIAEFYLKKLCEEHQQKIINCYRYLGLYYQAYYLFQQALKYYQKQLGKIKYYYGDYQVIQARCQISIGRCLYNVGKLQEAEKYIKLALDIINFNNYHNEYLRMQYQCTYLMCLINLLQQKQQFVIGYYYLIIQYYMIDKQYMKMKIENQILFNNNLEIQRIQNDINHAFINHNQKLIQSYKLISSNKEKGKALLNYKEISFRLKFVRYRKERYFLSQLIEESDKHHKKSKFLLQKLNELQQKQKLIKSYIEQKLKFALMSQQLRHNYAFFLIEKAISFLEKLTLNNNNVILINKVYIKFCKILELVENIQRCIQYCKKRIQLILNHRQQFDKYELIKCFLKLKNYFLKLKYYPDAIYYFKTLMNVYKDKQLNCLYDILCDFYLRSRLLNDNTKAFNCELKYYITKKQKEKQKQTKYTQLIQVCKILRKKSLIHLIDQYCIQFNLLQSQVNNPKFKKFNKDQYYEHFETLQSCKKLLYMKRKTKLFGLRRVRSIKETINQQKKILI